MNKAVGLLELRLEEVENLIAEQREFLSRRHSAKRTYELSKLVAEKIDLVDSLQLLQNPS